jgi:hypothetical protein
MNACSDVHPSADAGKLERLPVDEPSFEVDLTAPSTSAGSAHFSSGFCATFNRSGSTSIGVEG